MKQTKTEKVKADGFVLQMVKRLKQKFIIINMSLVSVILLVLFVVIFIAFNDSIAYPSKRVLANSLLALSATSGTESGAYGKVDENVSWVQLDANAGVIRFHAASNVDNVLLTAAAQEIYLRWKADDRWLFDEGIYETEKGSNFRYKFQHIFEDAAEEDDYGENSSYIKYTYIAFIRYDDELEIRNRMIWISVLILAFAVGLFVMLSIFLARFAVRPIEEAWGKQRRFIADASHELKTPITVILANSSILKSHPESQVKDMEKWISGTEAEAERMKELVGGMLFLARNDAGEGKIEHEEVNLSDVCMSVALNFESIAFEKNVTISTDIENGIFVSGDNGKLKQLVAILLDNACKYSDADTEIIVKLTTEDGHALLSVEDTGETISPSALPHIFERFFREDESRARKGGGYGLGLAIAQTIAGQHRAEIWATSKNRKTTFYIRF